LMFKGVSQCISTVGVLYFQVYFTLVDSISSITFPYPFKFPLPVFQQLSIHILISSTFTSYVLGYYLCFTSREPSFLLLWPGSLGSAVLPFLRTCLLFWNGSVVYFLSLLEYIFLRKQTF
jgi:hypothetical protein